MLVPSPTASPVRSAAWRIIRTPRFSSGSLSSSSLAMVTPSLQTIGTPNAAGSARIWTSGRASPGPRRQA